MLLLFTSYDLFSSTEMRGSLFQNNENESSLAYTDILYRFYEAYISELILRLFFF